MKNKTKLEKKENKLVWPNNFKLKTNLNHNKRNLDHEQPNHQPKPEQSEHDNTFVPYTCYCLLILHSGCSVFQKNKDQILGSTFTLSTSPRCTRSTLMTFSLVTFIVPGWSVTSRASDGCKDNSLASASDVFPFATCSIQRPREMNTNNIGGVSKKVIGLWLLFSTMATPTTTIWQRTDKYSNKKNSILKSDQNLSFPCTIKEGRRQMYRSNKEHHLSIHSYS